ncbi:hypothetical protein HID58_051887 [Brassica napus]|uniref:Peptidase C1A papain C-terminal domain-containing protein n=1 Tax=Brassica napus TaxID=3708 RepID=A0ABQ8AAE1_BRANA|nr:hypothetical protein HID58_051887 [Brassica napus]
MLDVAGSFSAVAGVERVTKIASGRLVSFSEQQLLDCDREYTTKAVTASPQRSPTLTKDQMGHAGPVQYQLHGSEVFSTSLATTSGYCWRLYRGTCFCLDGRECSQIMRLRLLDMGQARTGLSTGWQRTLGVKLGEKMVTLGSVETWLGLKGCVV